MLVITAFVFSDLIDGYMARATGTTSASARSSTPPSTGSATGRSSAACCCTSPAPATPQLYLCVTLYCLVMGSVTSYARARAESLGMQAKGGIAERADRLVAILLMTGLAGLLDLPILVEVTLWVLAAASTVTVLQRIMMVRKQSLAAPEQTPGP